MDLGTPKTKSTLKLSLRRRQQQQQPTISCSNAITTAAAASTSTNANTSTPLRSTGEPNEYCDSSPIYSQFLRNTQESNDDIDVVWDWNSPQANECKRRRKQQIGCKSSNNSTAIVGQDIAPPSPLSFTGFGGSGGGAATKTATTTQNFDQLRDELMALREQLAVPDDETSLCVSPLQEPDFMLSSNDDIPKHNVVNNNNNNVNDDDIFGDDDFDDEQLVLFSQQIEKRFEMETAAKNNNNIVNDGIEFDDSFDLAVTMAFRDDNKDIDRILLDATVVVGGAGGSAMSRIVDRKNSGNKRSTGEMLPRTQSDGLQQYQRKQQQSTTNRRLDFNRTKSFDRYADNNELTQRQLDDIERKRLEALARRKKIESSQQTVGSSCSSNSNDNDVMWRNVIEQKRLQAVAKLQATAKQRLLEEEMIERKRQEALRRLNQRKINNKH